VSDHGHARCSVGERLSGLRLRSAGSVLTETSWPQASRDPNFDELARVRRVLGRSGCPVPVPCGEHAGPVATVATRSWPRTSTTAPDISAVEPHSPPARKVPRGQKREWFVGRHFDIVPWRYVQGSRLSRGNQGSAAVGSARPRSSAATSGTELSTDAGEVEHSLSARWWPKRRVAEDRRPDPGKPGTGSRRIQPIGC
jgi:hypothetical protein